jgi:hypothetical protein
MTEPAAALAKYLRHQTTFAFIVVWGSSCGHAPPNAEPALAWVSRI